MQIVEGETRLKQQQNLYETVRADRNLYSKNLIQAQDEIQEMKRKFQIMVRALRYACNCTDNGLTCNMHYVTSMFGNSQTLTELLRQGCEGIQCQL